MDIIGEVKEVVGRIGGCDGIRAEQQLKLDLGLDSLSLISVIVGLEDKFNIVFDDGDLDPSKIVRVRDLIDLVGRYV